MTAQPMPIIVGAPRSGTTLLRFMIDSHPLIAIPPETGFLTEAARLARSGDASRDEVFHAVTAFPAEAPTWPDFGLDKRNYRDELEQIDPFTVAEGIRTFYRLYAGKEAKPFYGDKTPLYCEHITAIGELLAEAHFIHVVRDGRDAVLSLRHTWFAPSQNIASLALYWSRLVRTARDAGRHCPAYMEVRYEELVQNPQPVLQAVCRFLKLDFHPDMLRYWQRAPHRLKEHTARYRVDGSLVASHEQRLAQQRLTMQPLRPGRIGRWKKEMTAAETTQFLANAGDVLEELSYDTRPPE